jgi:hypothetical protein
MAIAYSCSCLSASSSAALYSSSCFFFFLFLASALLASSEAFASSSALAASYSKAFSSAPSGSPSPSSSSSSLPNTLFTAGLESIPLVATLFVNLTLTGKDIEGIYWFCLVLNQLQFWWLLRQVFLQPLARQFLSSFTRTESLLLFPKNISDI